MKLEAEALAEIANDACSAVFRAYGVDLVRQELASDPAEPLRSAGIVAYYGESIRGVCVVAATAQPLLRSAPAAMSESSLEDWVAEVANQLGGRIKNRLLAEGVAVTMSLPVVLDGEHLAKIGGRRNPPLAYQSSDGAVFVWVSIGGKDGRPERGPADEVVPEGFNTFWGDLDELNH